MRTTRLAAVLVSASALAACGGGGGGNDTAARQATTTTVATTTTYPPIPDDTTVTNALLTPADAGPDFSGGPPKLDDAVSPSTAVCGVDLPKAVKQAEMYLVTGDGRQVFEHVRFLEPAVAVEYMAAVRRRGEARCRYDESVQAGTYTVQVDGPATLERLGEETAGYTASYTGAYEGTRWVMVARRGRLVVQVSYTSKPPFDPAVATGVFRKAFEKAAGLV